MRHEQDAIDLRWPLGPGIFVALLFCSTYKTVSYQRAMPGHRFNQLLARHHANVIRLRSAILSKPGFTRLQKKVSWTRFVNRCRERDHEDGVGSRVTIPAVRRSHNHGTSLLFGRLGWEMRPPNLALERTAQIRWGHCGPPATQYQSWCSAQPYPPISAVPPTLHPMRCRSTPCTSHQFPAASPPTSAPVEANPEPPSPTQLHASAASPPQVPLILA